MRLVILCLAALLALLVTAWPVTAHGEDPDWPCVQRLVPSLTASGVWSGPPLPEGGAWRDAPAVAALVGRIAPRSFAAEAGVQAIETFAAPQDAASRMQLLPLLLAGLLEETNRVRGEMIERIKAFARRQRALAEIANRTAAALDDIPPDATGEAAARRAELAQQHFFEAKAFQDAERTLRYVCEAPVRLEARFGAYARALQTALPVGQEEHPR